jgi:hypothetical protein
VIRAPKRRRVRLAAEADLVVLVRGELETGVGFLSSLFARSTTLQGVQNFPVRLGREFCDKLLNLLRGRRLKIVAID